MPEGTLLSAEERNVPSGPKHYMNKIPDIYFSRFEFHLFSVKRLGLMIPQMPCDLPDEV